MLRFIFCTALSFVFGLAQPALAEFIPVQLDPIVHRPATLTIVRDDGTSVVYTPAQIEEFATFSLTTTTPWRPQPARFEGAMLADILARNGLADTQTLLVTAENDYATGISRAVLQSMPIMVATRLNGQAHTLRERGPIQFVVDAADFAQSPLQTEDSLVWMVKRIEAVE